jgi:hypothetical protein
MAARDGRHWFLVGISSNVPRLPNPQGRRAVCPLLANSVTDQGLGGGSAATAAGNLVLADVAPPVFHLTFSSGDHHKPVIDVGLSLYFSQVQSPSLNII